MKKLLLIFISVCLATSTSHAEATSDISGVSGALINDKGTVYLVTKDGQKRPYTSAGAFLSYRFNSWSNVIPNLGQAISLPVGNFIPPREGSIFCSDRGSDKGTCYLITAGTKAGFVSEEVFKALGYSFSNALYGDVSWLPSSAHIASAQESHRPGTVINKDGGWFLVGRSGLYGIVDLIDSTSRQTVLESWGFGVSEVVSANLADDALQGAGRLVTRQPGEITPVEDVGVPITITTADSLNLTQGVYANIAFKASFPYPTLLPVTFTFTQTGSVPGMVFEGYPCHQPGAQACVAIVSTDTVFLNGVPTTAGTYPIIVTAKDSAGNSATAHFTVSVSAGAVQPSIQVTSPVAGEQWVIGSTGSIRWVAPASVASVNIVADPYIACLYTEPRCMMAQPMGYTIAANVANTGMYNWTISSVVGGRNFSPGQYIITVTDASTGLGSSSQPFIIGALPGGW